MIILDKALINEELKKIHIDSINAKCKSCLKRLKCLECPNETLKFFCPEHEIIENESAYIYEIESFDKIEQIRKPNYDLTKKNKPVDMCFPKKTTHKCRMNDTCIFAHSFNERNIWEILRKHKITIDYLVLNNLKWKSITQVYNKNLNIYSLSSDLLQIATNGLDEFKIFLSNFNQDILIHEYDNKKTILHAMCDFMLLDIIKFLLSYNKLSECLRDGLDRKNFKNFLNHKDISGETALSSLLSLNPLNKNTINEISILFFDCDSYDLNADIGIEKSTILHRLIEQKNVQLIQYLCFNIIDKIDFKIKDCNNRSSKSLANLSSSDKLEKAERKIVDTINAALISKLIRNYVTVGTKLNISDENLNSFEFIFKKIKCSI